MFCHLLKEISSIKTIKNYKKSLGIFPKTVNYINYVMFIVSEFCLYYEIAYHRFWLSLIKVSDFFMSLDIDI